MPPPRILPTTFIDPESDLFEYYCDEFGIYQGLQDPKLPYEVSVYIGDKLVRQERWSASNDFIIEAFIRSYSDKVQGRMVVSCKHRSRDETVYKVYNDKVIVSRSKKSVINWAPVGEARTPITESEVLWFGETKKYRCKTCQKQIIGRRFLCKECEFRAMDNQWNLEQTAFQVQERRHQDRGKRFYE